MIKKIKRILGRQSFSEWFELEIEEKKIRIEITNEILDEIKIFLEQIPKEEKNQILIKCRDIIEILNNNK